MTDAAGAPLKKTALHAAHVALGGRMVPFAGWDMPVEYSGITNEHNTVRSAAGLFDVSHMGEIEIAEKDALAAVQHLTSNDASKLAVNQAQYSALMTAQGTFVDDLLVYRFAPNHFLFVVNASNVENDYAWIAEHAKAAGDVAIVNSSDRYALIAVQGPKARGIVQRLTGVDLSSIKYYWFAHGEIAGVRGTISRTGYTGEDGFEIFVAPQMATRVWNALLDAGKGDGLQPCGLGARDTLRLEAAMRPVRQRHRRHHHSARSGSRMDCRLAQTGVHRARRAASTEGVRRRTHHHRIRDGGARHCPARTPGDARQRTGRRCHQRHTDAVSQEGDRHGVCAEEHVATRHRILDRHPRPPCPRRRRAAAVYKRPKST